MPHELIRQLIDQFTLGTKHIQLINTLAYLAYSTTKKINPCLMFEYEVIEHLKDYKILLQGINTLGYSVTLNDT